MLPRCLWLRPSSCIGVGNGGGGGGGGGGQWGRLPPQAASYGGIAPTTQLSHPIFVVLALTIGSPHEIYEQV